MDEIEIVQARIDYLKVLPEGWEKLITSGIPIFQNLDEREKALMRIAYFNGGHAVADFYHGLLDKKER